MHRVLSLLLVTFLLCTTNAVADSKRYLTYETYKKLLTLCPEVKNAKLEGLLPAAEELWAKGQLKMPEETHVYRGDFNHDGKAECAIGITSDGTHFVLIAQEDSSGVFKRTGLVRTKGKINAFNGRAISVTPAGFVAWTGKQYSYQTGALAQYCYEYKSADFGGTMIKMTYVGPQDEPYPGLLISTFYRWPNLDAFKAHHKSEVGYANDQMPVLWHITMSPESLKRLVEALNKSNVLAKAEDRKGIEAGISHSLSILDTASAHRPNYYEVFLQPKEIVALLKSFAQNTSPENRQAAAVMQEYSKMFGE